MGSRRLNTGVPDELACEADEERNVVNLESRLNSLLGMIALLEVQYMCARGGARTRRSRNRRSIREAGITACRQ
jgi:hypothetical protein